MFNHDFHFVPEPFTILTRPSQPPFVTHALATTRGSKKERNLFVEGEEE